MTSAARLVTSSGGIISSEGQNFDTIETIENVPCGNDSERTNSPKLLDKITIKYYGTIPPLNVTKEHEVKNVADLLKLSREHLKTKLSNKFSNVQGFYLVTAPLFGLIDDKHKYWLVSTDTLISKSPTYYYRFQFCLPPESKSKSCRRLFQQDRFVGIYFFTQCRDDFINNRIPALYAGEKQDEMLGFVSVDYQIPKSSYDYKHTPNQTSKQPDHIPLQSYKFHSVWKHLPKKCRKEFYFPYNYYKLYIAIRDDLGPKGKVDLDSALTLQRDYVQGIFMGASEYCIDEFLGVPLNGFNTEQQSMVIKIQPYKEQSGVYFSGNYVFAIDDIMDIEHEKEHSINEIKLRVKIVLSSKCPEVIKFDYLDGLSFVYKLLGYHRIMVNYHIHVSKDLDSSASNQSVLTDLNCFGPMLKEDIYSTMKKKLNDFKRTNMGITSVYLIAQHLEEDKLVVHSLNSYDEKQSCPLEIVNGVYSVKITTDEKRTFKDRNDLLNYLRKTFGRQIKPDLYNGNVWLKKIFSKEKEKTNDRSEIATDSGPQFFSPSQYIIDPAAEKEDDLCVDTINVRLKANQETVLSMIQLKPSIPLPKKPTTDDLVELCDTLHKIKNSTFVKFFGVSTGLPYQVFVDCSPHGSLRSIIRNKFRNPDMEESNSEIDISGMEEITLLQFVTTATTVCQGLQYLMENGLHHGNIKCSNVFVYGLTNIQFDVKIGHPGLVKFYNKQPLTEALNRDRIPWIGVELFGDLSKCSIESEIYSFSTFLWEFLSYGKHPADELKSLDVRNVTEFYKDGGKLRKPATLEPNDFDFPLFKKTIKNQMWELMCECWSVNPENRPNVMDIIRRLVNMYSQYDTVVEKEINIDSLKQINPIKNCLCNVIEYKQLKLEGELGSGHYGEVKKYKYYPDLTKKECFERVAVKFIKVSMSDTPPERDLKKKLFEEEIRTMEKAQHKNVIKIIGVCYKGETTALIMELVTNGDLASWLKRNKKETLNDPYNNVYRKFVEEITEGMAYLSSKGIIHRDLAARNILITGEEHIKISDFGLAKCLLQEKDYYRMHSETQLPVLWTAPECFSKDKKVTREADVWSFGVVMWEIYSGGESPSLNKENHLGAVCSGSRLKKSDDWPDLIKTLMDKCWQIHKENRPSFDEILQELKRQ